MKEYFQVLETMIDSFPDTLLLLSEQGCIEGYHFGKAFEMFRGKDPLNHDIRELGQPWLSAIFEQAKNNISGYAEPLNFRQSCEIDGIQRHFEIRVAAGRGEAILFIIRDASELFDNSCEATVLLDENGEITECNNKFLELVQYSSKEDLMSMPLEKLSSEHQPEGKESRDEISRIIGIVQECGDYKFEWWLRKLCGTPVPVEIIMAKLNIDGKKIFCLNCRDIISRKSMECKLEYLGYHDQLTGLYNRRFYEEELKRMDNPRNYPLTIIVGDVNGLKLINDSFGHAKGDEVIRRMADAIAMGCRREDIIARLGGDEYVILLPKTSSEEAETIVERIKVTSAKEKVDSLIVSASFGWATKIDDRSTAQETFKQAEDFMYRQKLFESSSMKSRTISAIIKTLNEKNEREELHSIRVSNLCREFGRQLNLTEKQIKQLGTLGLFHDIGKISVEEGILKKENGLDSEELEQVRRHPETGFRILSTVNDMAEIAEYVLAHHEQWDGKGYPKGIKGEEIPVQSRILSILEAFDAMTSDKSYKKALTLDQAVAELEKNSGTQFDPYLVNVFIKKVLTCNYKNVRV